jgi:TonB-linked SusC/RagA family outer membrane protein
MIYKLTVRITLLLAIMFLCLLDIKLSAQDAVLSVSGMVTDQFGRPVPGVVINSENGKNGSASNAQGEYTILIDDQSRFLVFSGKGFASQTVSIEEKQEMDIKLQFDPHAKDEVIQLGYTTQLRNEISGAVSTVTGEELERAPVANLTQSFAGRLAGLTTMETSSELSRANTNLYIRGLSAARGNGPLVIIDGIICAYNSNQTLEYITANEIESVTILKDASTQALYGIQGANGLMVITTKRGKKGPLQIKARFDQSFQEVTTRPAYYHAADYAELRNQAALNDGQAANYLFSAQQIAGYRSGENKDLYPDNNWYNRYMRPFALMQRAGINVTGGSDKVQFFSNINFMHQGGQFKTDQPKYATNANNIWVNYRSNVDMNLNRYLKAFIRLSGNVKRERTPGSGNASIYGSLFQIPPTMYGPVTPEVLGPGGEVLDPGGKVITTERVANPTYGMLNRSGYYRHTVTNITSQFGLDLDMGFLTKGLNLTGIMAYQTNAVGSLGTTQNYERWVRTNNADALVFTKKGSEINTPLAYGKTHSYYYHLTYNLAANYKRDFGRHSIGGMVYMFYQNLTKADNTSPGLLPYNRVSSGVEVSYGFDNRYFLKADLGYSGSEQYARGSRYTATPAVSAAWIVSNEAFLANSSAISNLKLRASYGQTANDQSGLARFAYLDNVTVSGGGPVAYLQYNINENQRGNPFIQAEVSTKQNAGIDLGLFKSVSLSVDVFKERMDNMVVSAFSTIPLYQGVPLNLYPQTNSGIFENKGFELSLNYNKAVNRNLSLFAGGMVSYAKNKVINVNEALKTVDYAFRKWQEGYAYGQQFGYLVDYSNGNGFYNTAAELSGSNLVYGFGKPRLGDLKYQDLNNDGKIDERDKAPVGTGTMPQLVYAVTGGITYKSFDLNFLFQGLGKYETIMTGQGIFETDFDGVFGSLHSQAWTKERYESGAPITSPALSLAKSVNHEGSNYYLYNRSYLRLKNLELGYTLPAGLSKAISTEKIRFLLSGQNLITWDKMKSGDFGPEGGGYAAFPVYRVYNVGVNVIF